MRLLWSYLVIIMAPAIAILVIYCTMENALLDVQQEKMINLLAESVSTMNRELDQIVHVVEQAAKDDSIVEYLEEIPHLTGAQSFYKSYSLAVNYPDYRLMNWFIKNLYVFPEEGNYILPLPYVLPNDQRGWDTLTFLKDQENYKNIIEELSLLGKTKQQGLFCLESKEQGSSVVMLQQVLSPVSGQRIGYIMAELEERMVKNLLDRTLSGDKGIAYLADHENNILLLSNHLNKEETRWYGLNGYDYLRQVCKGKEKLTVVAENLDYNQWKLICGITDSAMSNRIGMIRYGILLLCCLSILIGIAICMKYWRSSWSVIEKYEQLQKNCEVQSCARKGLHGIWEQFGGVMDRIEELEKTVEQQTQWARLGILRRLLYGNYDTRQEVEAEACRMGIDLSMKFPCLLAVIKVGDLTNPEISMTEEEIGILLREHMEKGIPSGCCMVKMELLTHVLFLPEQSDPLAARQLFEKLNYEFYSRTPLSIYMGISDAVYDLMELNSAYEAASGYCEYAAYQKLRIPMLSGDVPENRYMIFTVDMEIQLEKIIRNGLVEQLKQQMDQIYENFLHHSRQQRHNMEVMRCITLRCLDEEPEDQQKKILQEKIRLSDKPKDIETCIYLVCEYFENKCSLEVDQEQIRLKKRLEEKINQEYSCQDFNLAALSDWVGVSEKKLYRDFKKMFGISFSSHLEMIRLRRAQELLQDGKAVQEVALLVGYSSDYSFRRAFKRVMGISPSEYQKLH